MAADETKTLTAKGARQAEAVLDATIRCLGEQGYAGTSLQRIAVPAIGDEVSGTVSRAVEETNRRMLRARDAMDRDYAQPLDIATLAKIAMVSEAHFIRTFRATFGETPHRYLQRRRVERAMFLLRETDRTVTEICFDVGFASLGTFTRTFTAIVGDPPTTYRWRAERPARGAGVLRQGVDATEQFRRSQVSGPANTFVPMLTSTKISQAYVLDQDQALDFYVGKLGMEVRTDADLGFMRWLTVGIPGEEGHELLLEKPGPPAHDDATAEQIRELVTKGALGAAAFFEVDDIHKTYEELKAKGVEFTDEPTERFYGTDCGLRDPFGNPIRIGQSKAEFEVPDPAELTKQFAQE